MAQSSACRMDTKQTPAAKAIYSTAPQRVPRDICILAIVKTFLNHEEIILTHTEMCCLLLPRN